MKNQHCMVVMHHMHILSKVWILFYCKKYETLIRNLFQRRDEIAREEEKKRKEEEERNLRIVILFSLQYIQQLETKHFNTSMASNIYTTLFTDKEALNDMTAMTYEIMILFIVDRNVNSLQKAEIHTKCKLLEKQILFYLNHLLLQYIGKIYSLISFLVNKNVIIPVII